MEQALLKQSATYSERMACCRGAKKSIGFIFKEFSSICRQLSCGYSASAFNGSQLVRAREISKPPLTINLLRRFSSTTSASEQMNLIRQLRERTSAPIKDVKFSLVSCNWDIEAAQKDLRKRGVVLASKKSSRTATEGLLAVAQTKNKAVVIELNCETDFVARNDIFQCLASSVARIALTVENPSQQAQVTFPFGYEYLEGLVVLQDCLL